MELLGLKWRTLNQILPHNLWHLLRVLGSWRTGISLVKKCLVWVILFRFKYTHHKQQYVYNITQYWTITIKEVKISLRFSWLDICDFLCFLNIILYYIIININLYYVITNKYIGPILYSYINWAEHLHFRRYLFQHIVGLMLFWSVPHFL